MTHAVIYDRASTKLQEDNFAREDARTEGIKIAEQNNFSWEYVKEIGSGTTLSGRPEMLTILDRIEAGEVQAIVVSDLDRLARPEEAVVYQTIRNVIMTHGTIIYTRGGPIDLRDDNQDFMADIQMSVAKLERKKFLKRAARGRKARAEAGRFAAGTVSLGYRLEGTRKTARMVIDEAEAALVRKVFNSLVETGGNLRQVALQMNEAGHTGKRGGPFRSNSIRTIAHNRLYIGILESGVTEQVTHRPDLQIIGVDQFNRVQQLLESRGGRIGVQGRRGSYPLSGFVVCGNCGGPLFGATHGDSGDTRYRCSDYRTFGKSACAHPTSYSAHLITPPIIETVAQIVQDDLDLRTDMRKAAASLDRSGVEQSHEARVKGKLEAVKAEKKRLVNGVKIGAFEAVDIAADMAELKEKERNLQIELAVGIKKDEAKGEWQVALDSFEGMEPGELQGRLTFLEQYNPRAFRRVLGIIFEPGSIQVSTHRAGRYYSGQVDNYTLTPGILELREQAKRFMAASVVHQNVFG